MIFDLVALNGGVRYLYKDGELLSTIVYDPYQNAQNSPTTITNTEHYLEFYQNRQSGDDTDIKIVFANGNIEHKNAKIDLTHCSKLIFTVVNCTLTIISGAGDLAYSNPMIFITNQYDLFKNYPEGYGRITYINKSDVEQQYEIDVSDLTGEYWVGYMSLAKSESGYVRISEIRLQ